MTISSTKHTTFFRGKRCVVCIDPEGCWISPVPSVKWRRLWQPRDPRLRWWALDRGRPKEWWWGEMNGNLWLCWMAGDFGERFASWDILVLWPHMWNPSSHLQFHHACVLLAHEVMKSWVVASLPPTQTCTTVIPEHPHKTSLQYLERSWSKNKTSWKHHGSFARLGNSRDPETGELNASFTASAQLSTSSLWCVGKVLCGEVLHLKDDFLWIPCDYTVRSPT